MLARQFVDLPKDFTTSLCFLHEYLQKIVERKEKKKKEREFRQFKQTHFNSEYRHSKFH